METVLNLVQPLFEMYAHLLPQGVIGVLAFIGSCRLIIKPALSLAYSIVELTPSKKDDEMVKKVEASKAMQVVQYVLNWIFSLKKPEAKK